MLLFAIIITAALIVLGWGLSLRRPGAVVTGVVAALVLVLLAAYSIWPRLVYLMLPYEYRPERIAYPVEVYSDAQFEELAGKLVTEYADSSDALLAASGIRSVEERSGFTHIDHFRRAGIRGYEGPRTCLACHKTITIADGDGGWRDVDLRNDVTRNVHFTFSPKTGFSTYGFNGEKVKNFPLGKIDRACGVTGTFTWTGWAVTVATSHGDTVSEGCGQCHVVGQYGPISSAMMPLYRATDAEFKATDCLICHAVDYDMNRRQVVTDANGKSRWEQDRRLMAAMSVRRPTDDMCLRCHQHNLGGDTYPPNPATAAPGRERPRVAHPGAKRGTPFGADWDVHAAAGLECLDCHTAQGHRIARGKRGVDLVANDLPDVEVSCENCHTAEPHSTGEYADYYNMHTDYIACETCHIHRLYPDNLIFRDWSKSVFNEEHGIYTPTNAPFSGEPGVGIVYRWFNGNGTFMANALGDNPNGLGLYKALSGQPNRLWEGWKDFDLDADYEKTFRPIARTGKSKIWPFKRFQAVMYEDLNNQGPYGGMILPVDYTVYYKTGDPVAAVQKAVESPIMREMYGWMFKVYLMDRFMAYMAVDGWDTNFDIKRISPAPMRNEGNLMINHAIQKVGRDCSQCHSPDGILDFEALGYPPERAAELREPML